MTRPAYGNFIGGQFVPAASGRTLDTIEPATGSVWATVPASGPEDVRAAVAAATAAFPAWAARPAAERSRSLLAIADRIEALSEEFARAESTDTGKPLELARRMDVPRAVQNFRFFATAILHTRTDAHTTDGRALNLTLRAPRGVAVLIAPWNLPLYLMSWKVAPALAAGNTAVAKPSELAPVTACLLGEVAAECGLPPGVLNIVHGTGAEVGAPLVAHPGVACISFTGGTATGRAIAAAAGPLFRPMTLELGGKNPTLIFADADLDLAVEGALRSAFTNQGEICLCGSRMLIEESIRERFLAAFLPRVAALRVGDPLEPDTDQGAVISEAHAGTITGAIARAIALGGTVLAGGPARPVVTGRCARGAFVQPTVLADLPMDCLTNQEEIFGPVVTLTTFRTEAEAIALANASRYGLAASVWTRDLDRAHRVAQAVACGTIWVNCWLLRDLRVPFGGMGESGLGREGGDDALRFFTEDKNLCIRLAP